ncbi:sensor histidine kinase [Waterburya agarophytonicola K14]|uniref:histidine kinase n=1 Tax=Waterburya agarophytonicola KI4 TaxID=2874699 RepID=A0A964BPH1_9CYAN|nr:sensor histidine kinase [Waterburya agarophytonicola]MCC0176108.1 sensor histidine kinase [Waterburya agarophytonicola KI4]
MSNKKALAYKLLDNIEPITDNWIEAIKQDKLIKSSRKLTFTSIKDHLPELLTVIFRAFAGEINIKLDNCDQDRGESHGFSRAIQNFDTEEIAREYYLLKEILLHRLQEDLLVSSPQEIIEAIATLNQVIDEVMANSFKSYTQRRLNQLENLHTQLLLTNQELTRLIEDHRDNLSYLTHEIKNPLTSIIGYSDLFLRQQQIKPLASTIDNLGHIEQVLTQGRKILRLVNDTLEISSYSKGKIKLTSQSVDVCQLLDSVAISLKSAIEAKGLQLIASCTPEPLKIQTDSLRLQQIISNLVSNAIRYTATGTIKVLCQQISSDRFKIVVSDTGIGISQADYQRIFEPYFRVTQPDRCVVPEGVGLGLAIVSQLVKLLGGEIQLESEINVGSTFVIILPIT